MIPTKIRVGLLVLALVGCRDKEPEMAQISEVLPNLPMPPRAGIVSREGGADAVKLTLVSNATPAEVEAYYREVLSERKGWRLVSDTRDGEGAVVLMAEQDGPPLWVRIQGTSDSARTMVELAGAATPRPKPAKGADSTKPTEPADSTRPAKPAS
jgi:hypothetical protein